MGKGKRKPPKLVKGGLKTTDREWISRELAKIGYIKPAEVKPAEAEPVRPVPSSAPIAARIRAARATRTGYRISGYPARRNRWGDYAWFGFTMAMVYFCVGIAIQLIHGPTFMWLAFMGVASVFWLLAARALWHSRRR